MMKKYGKFYADWTDDKGRRHRKALPTKRAALDYQRRRRLETAAKKAGSRARSASSHGTGKRSPRRAATKRQPQDS
ncbi:MAG: hypothetical protein ACRD50_10165 [Candidatus Acidiferrales bacterium]